MLLSVGILGIVAIYVLIYGTSQRHYTVTDPQHNHPQHTSTGDESVSSHQRTIVEPEVIEPITRALIHNRRPRPEEKDEFDYDLHGDDNCIYGQVDGYCRPAPSSVSQAELINQYNAYNLGG